MADAHLVDSMSYEPWLKPVQRPSYLRTWYKVVMDVAKNKREFGAALQMVRAVTGTNEGLTCAFFECLVYHPGTRVL